MIAAIELAKQLRVAEAENERLAGRVGELTAALEEIKDDFAGVADECGATDMGRHAVRQTARDVVEMIDKALSGDGSAVADVVRAARDYADAVDHHLKGPEVHTAYVRLVEALDNLESPAVAACDHDWVDVRNKIIKDGEWCPKCNAIRAGNEATDKMEGTTP